MDRQQEIQNRLAAQIGEMHIQIVALQVDLAAARQRNEALEAQVKAAGAP